VTLVTHGLQGVTSVGWLWGMANAFLLATATALVVAWPLRLLGRWLQRKGRDVERNRKDASDR
jgi:hypothetical protein